MAMFTKLFTRSHFPYELKGRWYKLTVSADEDTGYLSVIKSDIPVFDEDAPAFGYSVEDNILFVMNGYVLDYTYIALSGSPGRFAWTNAVDPDIGALSSIPIENAFGALFDLYLYIVKSNGSQNYDSGSDDGSDGGSDDGGSDDGGIH